MEKVDELIVKLKQEKKNGVFTLEKTLLACSGVRTDKEVGYLKKIRKLAQKSKQRINDKWSKGGYKGVHGTASALAEIIGGEKKYQGGQFEFDKSIDALSKIYSINPFGSKKIGNETALAATYLVMAKHIWSKGIKDKQLKLGLLTSWGEAKPFIAVNQQGTRVNYVVNLREEDLIKRVEPLEKIPEGYNLFDINHVVSRLLLNKAWQTHERQEHLDAGISYCDKALFLQPGYSDAFLMKGICKRDRGLIHGAIKDINKSIRMQPFSPVAFLERGDTYLLRKGEEYPRSDNEYLAESDYQEVLDNFKGSQYSEVRKIAESKLADLKKGFSQRIANETQTERYLRVANEHKKKKSGVSPK